VLRHVIIVLPLFVSIQQDCENLWPRVRLTASRHGWSGKTYGRISVSNFLYVLHIFIKQCIF